MKASARLRAIALLLAAILSLAVTPSTHARPPMSREMSGTVQRMDRQTLILQPAGPTKPVTLAFDRKRTKFVRGNHFVSAEALRAGTAVQVRYRTPFFGERFATRVSWRSPDEDGQKK